MRKRPLWMMTLVTWVFLLGTVCAWAQSAPPSKSKAASVTPFTRTGTLQNVPAETVLIEDALYHVANGMLVYVYDASIKDPKELREKAKTQHRNSLRAGMKVGYTVEGEGGGKPGTITEIWVLPNDSVQTLKHKE